MGQIPVIVLSGFLGAGKTTTLNHLLRRPGSRLGVIVNDFGDVNVDASLVSGQIDEPASIAGGCLCCLPDAGGLDDALEKLSHPRLRLDAIVVEASGIAEPGALARLVRYSEAPRIRYGGVIEIVDAPGYFSTIDTGGLAPARFAAASLVAINKVDLLPEDSAVATLDAIGTRIRESNPDVHIAHITRGRLDPELLYDAGHADPTTPELPFDEVLAAEHAHIHAASVTATADEPVDPSRVLGFLEDPPPSAYRIKGHMTVRAGDTRRTYTVNNVAGSIHLSRARTAAEDTRLVAIGVDLDVDSTRERMEAALSPADRTGRTDWGGLKRLQRYHRLSRP